MDEKKAQAYANLTVAIGLKKFDSSLYHRAIITLKEISWDDLESLKKVYITNRFSIGCSSTTQMPKQPNDFMRQGEDAPLAMVLSTTNLKSKGLLDSDNISRFGRMLIEATYTKQQITTDSLLTEDWSENRWSLMIVEEKLEPGKFGSPLPGDHKNQVHNSMSHRMKLEKEISLINLSNFHKLPYTNCFIIIGPKNPNHETLDTFLKITGGRPTIQIKIMDQEWAMIGENVFFEDDDNSVENIREYPDKIPGLLLEIIERKKSTSMEHSAQN